MELLIGTGRRRPDNHHHFQSTEKLRTLWDGKIKFRANGAWGVPNGEFGGGDEEGKLFPKGADIPVTAGKYQIIVDLSTTDYTYKLIAQ